MADSGDPTGGWSTRVDKNTGRTYYVNKGTGQSSWVCPPGVQLPSSSEGVWLEVMDESRGIPYYYNKTLKQTTWVRPTGAVIRKKVKKKDVNGDSDDEGEDEDGDNEKEPEEKEEKAPPSDLPDGWKAVLNKQYGRYYFYCAATGETTWSKPKAEAETSNAVVPAPVPAPAVAPSPTGFEPPQRPPVAAVPAPAPPKQTHTHQAPQLIAAIPAELASEIHKFQLRDYAEAHFARRKRGFFFRRVVPTDEVLRFQRDPLSAPLLRLPQSLVKDALQCFRLVLGYMGERTGTRGDNLHLARTLLQHGLTSAGLRDEIYIQLIKQTTDNENKQSLMRGWELLLLCASCFPPAKDFENYLLTFLHKHQGADMAGGGEGESRGGDADDDDVRAFARLTLNRVKLSIQRGPRGSVPSGEEIESAREAPYHPTIFGVTLEEAMAIQASDGSPDGASLTVPRVLETLTQAVLVSDGMKTEGIFRLPGDMDEVARLRLQIDRGDYKMPHFEVPHTPASLLKLWMRDLAEPVIPNAMYDRCLEASASIDSSLAALEALPAINRTVALFVIRFLQRFAAAGVSSVTMMGSENLAMVFSPNFLRCPSQDPQVILECSRKERTFLMNLIENVK